MRALAVASWGTNPAITSVAKAATPAAGSGKTEIRVLASALPQLVRSQAAGTHYSVQDQALPYVPGIDGTGFTPDKKLVYMNLLANEPSGGGFAEYVNVDDRLLTPVPVPSGSSEEATKRVGIKVASLMNPAMSSWMALRHRAHISTFTSSNTPWTAVILGVTSASGRIAALFARHMGAKSVIGAARNASDLETLKSRGIIDAAIPLDKTDVSKTDFSVLSQSLDSYPLVVLDYIYGSAALALLNALPRSANKSEQLEVRYVHIGTLSREFDMALPGTLLRMKNVTISGAGPGSWSVRALAKDTPELAQTIVDVIPSEGWEAEYAVVERRLEDVDAAFADTQGRTVFVV